jgi:hypothetical protein
MLLRERKSFSLLSIGAIMNERKRTNVYSPVSISDLYTPKTESVADDRHRAEAHGGGSYNGAQKKSEKWIQHTCCDRNAQGVVYKGEEEILFNIPDGHPAEPDGAYDGS